MKRPHYRRVTKGRQATGVKRKKDAPRSAFSERLVTQFIVCGMIMALILMINLFDTSLTHGFSADVKNAIQGQPTADDVRQVLSNATDTVRSVLGNTVDDKLIDDFDFTSDAWIYNEEDYGGNAAATQEPTDFRIDEDILNLIQAESGGK